MKEIVVTIYGKSNNSTSTEKININVDNNFRIIGSTKQTYEDAERIIREKYMDKIEKFRFKEFKVTYCEEKR